MLTEFCQENALVVANTIFQQHKKRLHMDIFQMDLEKSEEPEIKLPTSAGSSKKQESSRKKHLLLLY